MNLGVAFLVLAMLLTPAADGVAKSLAAEQSPVAIAFVRYLSAGLIALAVAGLAGRPIVVPRGDRAGQLVRTGLIMAAMTSLIAALGMVPMAKAVGGFLIAPVVSGLLGILVWREPPTAPRLAGSGLAFLGAALLLRPEAGLEPGCLLALLGGAFLGTYLAATRGAREATDALSTLAVQSLLGAALLAPFALAGGLPAGVPGLLPAALALGGISAACHFLTVAAYRRAEASVLAPFLYFNLLAAIAVGFLWFGETPAWSSLAGLLAIVGGGLAALVRPRPPEGRRLPPATSASRDSMVVP
jgi:drug/metabolite transporter (DMT)-like permease